MRILIVEDDPKQSENYIDEIENFNAVSEDLRIRADKADTFEKALELLDQNNYDAAIVDLKLGPIQSKETKGNDLLKLITEQRRFPVFVVTGVPQDLDASFQQTPFLRLEPRGSKDVSTLIHELSAIYRTGVTKILGNRGLIDSILVEIFWKHISSSIEYWTSSNDDTDSKERKLSRHILNHIDEHLGYDSVSSDSFAAPEFYIIPPIKPALYTGDIIQHNPTEAIFVIMTPACDMELRNSSNGSPVRKASFAVLCKIVSEKNVDVRYDFKCPSSTLKQIMKNNNLRYHYIPSYSLMKEGFIDFQNIQSIPLELDDKEYTRIGSISSKFLKDVISRYVNYMNRQGQPDLS